MIHAETGGVAIAISGVTSGLAGSLSVGAFRFREHDWQRWSIRQGVYRQFLRQAQGNVSLSSLGEAEINASAIGGAGEGSGSASGIALAGAIGGAVTSNNINESILSAIRNESDVSTVAGSGGNINLSSTDASSITGDAGGVAIAIALGTGGGGGLSVGFAQATNTIGNTTTSDIDKSLVTADGGVSITATSHASIDAFSYGGAGSVGAGESVGIAVAGAGAGANNNVNDNTYAYINNSQATDGNGVTATTGGVGCRPPMTHQSSPRPMAAASRPLPGQISRPV